MADDFTRRKFVWLDQVANDGNVSAEAFRLAYILASQFLNRGTGDAWPSQAALADRLGLRSPRSIKHLIDQLVSQKHLDVVVGRGRGHSNRYKPQMHEVEDCGGSLFELSGEAEPPLNGPPAHDTGFEAWWLQFPKKVGKAHARKAYIRIMKAGSASAEQLLTGAMRYAAERSNQDAKFTKHPATWLNAESWLDETIPNQGRVSGAQSPLAPATGAASAMAGIMDWLNGTSGMDTFDDDTARTY